MAAEDVANVREHVRNAIDELHEASESTTCGWCSGMFEKNVGILEELEALSSYTDKTADKVRSMSEKELAEMGGKVETLRRVVREEKGGITSDSFIGGQMDASERGISMVSKKEATYLVGAQLVAGAGFGFLANRIEEMYGAQYGMGVGAPWYKRLAPALNLGAGLALVIMGVTGKVLKKPSMRNFGVVGGGAMMANAALQYLEGFYKTMAPAAARNPAVRSYAPMGRPSGAMNPRPVEIVSF